jgi:hypothetical protein
MTGHPYWTNHFELYCLVVVVVVAAVASAAFVLTNAFYLPKQWHDPDKSGASRK